MLFEGLPENGNFVTGDDVTKGIVELVSDDIPEYSVGPPITRGNLLGIEQITGLIMGSAAY
jgi:hypothetical protein